MNYVEKFARRVFAGIIALVMALSIAVIPLMATTIAIAEGMTDDAEPTDPTDTIVPKGTEDDGDTEPGEDPDNPENPSNEPVELIAVTIKANNAKKTYGNADPELTWTANGLQEGDDISVLSIDSISRAEGETVDKYTISVTGAEIQGKYKVTYKPGTFTINKRSVTVTGAKTATIAYDGQEHVGDPGYTVKNTLEGHTATVTYTPPKGTVPGTYNGEFGTDLTVVDENGEDVSRNYKLNSKPGKLTITQRSVTVSVEDDSCGFDGQEHVGKEEYTFSNVVEGHLATITYTPAKGTNAAEYTGSFDEETFKVMAGDDDVTEYYTLTKMMPGKLTITKSEEELKVKSADGDEWTYDGNAHTKHEYTVMYGDETYTVTVAEGETTGTATLSTGDTVTITPAAEASITHVAQGNVANTFTWTVTNEDSYTKGADTYGTLSIVPATLTVTTGTDSKEYNGEPLTAAGSISGFVNGETADFTVTGTITNAGEVTNGYTLVFAGEEGASETATAVRSDYMLDEHLGTLTVTQTESSFQFKNGDYREGNYTFTAEEEKAYLFDFGAELLGTENLEGREITYSIEPKDTDAEYGFNESTGELSVTTLGGYTITATITGNNNYFEKTISCNLQIITKKNVLQFNDNSVDYILGTNDIISEQQVSAPEFTKQLRKLSITYSIDKKDIGIEIENVNSSYRGGKVTVKDYKKLAEALQTNEGSVVVTVRAESEAYYIGWDYLTGEPTVPADWATYTITITFADMPEGASYTVADPNGDNGWYVLNEGQNVLVHPHEGYKIGYDVLSFGESLEIEDQGDEVTKTVYLRKIEDGGITAPITVGPIKIDYEKPVDLGVVTVEDPKSIIQDVISLGFFQSNVTFRFSAADDTSGLDRVEWTYTRADGVSTTIKDEDSGTLYFTDGQDSVEKMLSGDYRGTISFKVYDKAGNCTEWNNGNPSGVFVLDSTAPVFVSATYNDKTIDQTTYFFNQSDLNETAGGNTVTAEFIINEANFFGEDPVVTINGETINGQKPETEETIEGNVEWQRKEGTEEDADNYTGTFTFSGDGYYHVGVTYTDRSGNVMEPAYQSETIVIDTTLPVLDPNEIDYGTEADTVKEEGIHYYGLNQNGRATITLKITENNFIAGGVTVMVNGVKTAVEEWQHDGSVHTGSFTISGDGEYKFTVGVTDEAGNAMEQVESETIIIDTVRPTINVSYSPNDIVNSIGGVDYYKTTQIATVTFTEDHFDGGQVTITGGRLTSTSWDKKKEGDNQHTATVQFDGDEQYKFSVSVTDKAGNEADTYSHQLTVDKTPPSNVSVTVTGGTVDETIQNVIFFKDQVPVTVSADDATAGVNSFSFVYNRNADASTINVEKLNKYISGAAITQNGNRYTASFTLPEDAAEALKKAEMCGTLSVTATDRSGNAASGSYRNTVVLDTESPKISVEFTVEAGKDPAKEKADAWYFNNKPVGTITIDEANFYPQQVRITATKDGAPYEIQISDWKPAENGTDKHIGTFTLTEEGDYIITVEYTDGSGNEAKTYTTERRITVDTTIDNAPTIKINDQEITDEDGGVYAGAVKVGYKMSDLNLDREKCTVQVLYTPSFEEKKDVTEEREYGKQDFSIDDKNHMTTCTGGFTIIEETEAVEGLFKDDGIYDLIITMTDLAGNEASKHVQFAVCRHGSVYRYDEYFAGKIGQYLGATNEAINKDVVIYEYCPTDLATEEDTIIIKVYRNIDEEVAGENDIKREAVQQDPNNGWYQYKYVIDKSCFTQDGEYKIFISSAYKAMDKVKARESRISSIGDDNSFDNRGSQMKGEAWFVVDTTAPDISSVVNLDKASVNADSLTVNFTVEENYGIQSVEVLINDQVTETKLEQVGSTYSYAFDIPSGMDEKVVIRVTDTAGNVTDTSASDFTKSINDRYKFKDTITVSSNPFIRWYANKPAFWGTIGGVAAAAGGLGTAAVVRRRKKGII